MGKVAFERLEAAIAKGARREAQTMASAYDDESLLGSNLSEIIKKILIGWILCDDLVDAIAICLDLGASIREVSSDGNNALWLAITCKRADSDQVKQLVHLFVTHGGDTDAPVNAEEEELDWPAGTPLHKSISTSTRIDRLNAVTALLEAGADTEVRTTNGDTPLHYAVSYDRPEIVRKLIEYGANLDAKGERSRTPLHLAASSGYYEAAQILVSNGADVNARDVDGKTPRSVAITQGKIRRRNYGEESAEGNRRVDILLKKNRGKRW